MSGVVAGVDEAGRGPIIGPMVIGAVAGDERVREELAKMGVRDSKKLSPKKRSELASKIASATRVEAFVVPPGVIDSHVKATGGNLNELEALLMGELIRTLKPSEAVVDALGSEAKFARKVSDYAGGIPVRATHDADSSCPFVSAASIVAKVIRDNAVSAVLFAGSGYPSDRKTIEFLSRVGMDPSFVRKSWKLNARAFR
ncbi:ribonuclease HII [Tardisphaera miroshnichenkoae]